MAIHMCRLAMSLQNGNYANLLTLDLRCNSIGREGAAALAKTLGNGNCPMLHTLDLRSNSIGPEGTVDLAW